LAIENWSLAIENRILDRSIASYKFSILNSQLLSTARFSAEEQA
jgi:hypothetical protein